MDLPNKGQWAVYESSFVGQSLILPPDDSSMHEIKTDPLLNLKANFDFNFITTAIMYLRENRRAPKRYSPEPPPPRATKPKKSGRKTKKQAPKSGVQKKKSPKRKATGRGARPVPAPAVLVPSRTVRGRLVRNSNGLFERAGIPVVRLPPIAVPAVGPAANPHAAPVAASPHTSAANSSSAPAAALATTPPNGSARPARPADYKTPSRGPLSSPISPPARAGAGALNTTAQPATNQSPTGHKTRSRTHIKTPSPTAPTSHLSSRFQRSPTPAPSPPTQISSKPKTPSPPVDQKPTQTPSPPRPAQETPAAGTGYLLVDTSLPSFQEFRDTNINAMRRISQNSNSSDEGNFSPPASHLGSSVSPPAISPSTRGRAPQTVPQAVPQAPVANMAPQAAARAPGQQAQVQPQQAQVQPQQGQPGGWVRQQAGQGTDGRWSFIERLGFGSASRSPPPQ